IAFGYTVRPFAAAIAPPTQSGDNLIFSSATRVTANTALLTSNVLNYQWDLVDGTTLAPVAGVTGASGTNPSWSISKTSAIALHPGCRVRLIVTSANTA